MSEIVALAPIFDPDPNPANQFYLDRFCSIDTGLAPMNMQSLCLSIAGKPDKLVGLYVPKSVDPEDFAQGLRGLPQTHGRVTTLVRVLPMPSGHNMTHYPANVMKFTMQSGLIQRWPIGWPCEAVFFSAYGGPVLEYMCLNAKLKFTDLTHQFFQGTIDLRRWLYATLRWHLWNEVDTIRRIYPTTQLRPF